MQSFAEWLREVGLERYGPAFAEHGIDFDVVRDLSDEELRGLGLTLGDRKRLLQALAASAPGPSGKGVPQAPAPPATAPEATGPSAERRQLTVLFCDLVGSTELSRVLDPEQLRELMRAYQQACGSVIGRYAGHVAQYLGDGVMVYFGWPRAHEDDAERAVRAGLDIVEAVKKVPAPQPLRVRIGIATGPVVVGETGAGDASSPKLAVGETPNLAARLQALAQGDEVVIAPSTQRLVGAAFELRDLGERALKGIDEPVRPWRVQREAQVEGRFEASHGAQLTALVGRDRRRKALDGIPDESATGHRRGRSVERPPPLAYDEGGQAVAASRRSSVRAGRACGCAQPVAHRRAGHSGCR